MAPSAPGASAQSGSVQGGAHDGLDHKVVRDFFALACGWWSGATARRAWFLTAALAALLIVNVGINFLVNAWNRRFFDALEATETATVAWAVVAFVGLVLGAAAVGVGVVMSRETLQVRWREWLVATLLDRWIGRQRYYRMGLAGTEPANPEYRIADDTRMATEPIVDFAIGLLSSLVSALTFVGVLWMVGGSLTIHVGDGRFVVPGYMVLAAIVYGVAMSGLMLWIGRSLPGAVARRNEGEAKLRFELTRLRENSESVALIRGEADERRALGATYADLVGRWLGVVARHGRITWLTNSNGVFIPVLPLLLAAPKYLSGDFTLGQVTQLAGAFMQVQLAIAWLVDNYRAIAQCYASMQRVTDLTRAIDEIDDGFGEGETGGVRLTPSMSGAVRLEALTIAGRSGRPLIDTVTLAIAPGERVMISGESGAGKSTLVRALAGLWPWGSGTIALPAGGAVAFVPQRAYLPAGTLRAALAYPAQSAALDDAVLAEALAEVGLGYLAGRLDDAERWDQILSNGERQRLAVARLLVQKPDLVILDGATSALDEAGEARLMAVLTRALDGATLISVGLRPGLEALHDRKLVLARGDGGARLSSAPLAARLPAPTS
ncbi:ABC transporter ATP-binding protein/permease [Phreatobacter sp. AB_2022a]|uniref:ABC transporter ATP-binding protein/permease n=1 Tax=Phreatobacter sp. AB_2022a TaxID=3003134 RepID=UPI002286FDDE|nr:ABC transporter ATP-binding protein/permease [Phreatobacter sp. AB_2022a]MCZ0734697.1 ABC transporter ATP-binding protein/permease [Phreatobacter sp. AB_2022a]